jgi:hypothetical protein
MENHKNVLLALTRRRVRMHTAEPGRGELGERGVKQRLVDRALRVAHPAVAGWAGDRSADVLSVHRKQTTCSKSADCWPS